MTKTKFTYEARKWGVSMALIMAEAAGVCLAVRQLWALTCGVKGR